MEPKRIIPKIESTSPNQAKTKQPTMNVAPKSEPADKVFEPEKMKKKSGGKGLMTLTIILAILAIAAGAFAYIQYSQAKKDKDDLKAFQTTTQQQLTKAKSDLESAAKSATQSTDTYVKIKEWGVEYKNPSDLGYLVYAYNAGNKVSYLSSTSLMTAHLTAYDADKATPKKDNSSDDCGVQSGALGALSRGKAGEQAENSGLTYDKVTGAKKIGDYYYIFTQPQAACTAYATVAQLQQTQIKTAKTIVDSLRAIQ